MSCVQVERLGDGALLLRWGDAADAAVNRQVHACARALRQRRPGWLTDLTPAFASLALHVDTARIGGPDPLATARRAIEDWLAHHARGANPDEGRIVTIPVLYGGEAGPDLADVAAQAGLSVADAIARHAAGDYRVAMIGFAPGFPYLLGLDAALAMPRLSSPRPRVAAGSVGIGGAQAGIYPLAGPGGWRLLGRTPLRLFDASRDPPSLLRPGDRVRFEPIDAAAFDAFAAGAA